MRVEFFIDPASGWSRWTPASLVEDAPHADEDRLAARRPPTGQSLQLRLLGWVGAWVGVAEQAPSGEWRRIPASRRDPWEPGGHRHRTVWSWWCR
jgi:hypothetical protein